MDLEDGRGLSADEETDHVTFIVDTTFPEGDVVCVPSDGEREDEYFQMPEVPQEIDDTEAWTLYTDGAASSKGSGAGLVLTGLVE
ncbi:hypothetical protein Tco_0589430 [Tanacetum coccineum]